MFTGIVEEVGTVEQLRKGTYSAVITIRGKKVLENTKIGDSIAVNGICLTVTALSEGSGKFSADIMHETLNRSSLARLACGSHVNLERAMAADGRFGGHMVAGHVDGVGKIIGVKRDDTAVWYTIEAGPDILRYVVEKGSIAVDGISLTVAAVSETDFSVSTIPHTVSQTVLQERKEGELVNLETDMIGKYVEKLLIVKQQKKSAITREFLSRYEF